MQPTFQKDPYQLVYQAFERNELRELLLGEKNYNFKWDIRSDYTYPIEKTDVGAIYKRLIQYYLNHNKNPYITQKVADAIAGIPETFWGISILESLICYEASERHDKKPDLDLDLNTIAGRLKKIIHDKRVELMQEKELRGQGLNQGMYEYLTRRSAQSVGNGGPAFVEENPHVNDHFEALTSFTLVLPNKLFDLDKELRRIGLGASKLIMKGTPIPQGNGYTAAQDTTWIFTMEREKQPTAEIQFICMVNQLYVRRVKLLKLIDEFGLKPQLDTTVWLEQPNQSINLSAEVLQKISEMQIPFSIEIHLTENAPSKKEK